MRIDAQVEERAHLVSIVTKEKTALWATKQVLNTESLGNQAHKNVMLTELLFSLKELLKRKTQKGDGK